jgi:hypothetical protein
MAPSRYHSFPREFHRRWKHCLSFLKKDWQLRDYPLHLRRQSDVPADPDSRFKIYPWLAQIDGWNVIGGTGNTRDEALADLSAKFEKEKSERVSKGEPLPRPGTDVPVQFASSSRIDVRAALLDDFIHRVLELEWALVTDQTQLWHFSLGQSNDVYIDRIRDLYGVDCSDLADAPIADILDRIATCRKH